MAYDKNILITTVINSYDGELIKDKTGRILTRKPDKSTHGFGLRSIEKIVHKYHGSVVIENTQEEFKIIFILIDNKRQVKVTYNLVKVTWKKINDKNECMITKKIIIKYIQGGTNMKWIKNNLQNVMCLIAMMFSVMAANSRCMCIYHDLEKPEELKRLRKF